MLASYPATPRTLPAPSRAAWPDGTGAGRALRAFFALAGASLAGLLALQGPAAAEEAGVKPVPSPRAVIELFTSQGCSSCPPADRLVGELGQQPDVMTLTLAVDYWDYLGWKDTLAKHGHSLRQKAYAKLRGDGQMFTPQAVVNGSFMTVGSDRAALERAIAGDQRLPVPVEIDTRDGRVTVRVGASPPGTGSGEVWLCPVASSMTVDIGRGENEGTKITYHNVVRGWTKLGDWTGGEARFDTVLRPQPGFNADAVAVLVQSGNASEPGRIVGAALQPLR
ncbi:hypothetical protein FHS55_001102 [Angulomicrobium tetraedrale]|uniref:DUF1223 domain-containing protein n=1 Tax=Ancylobacter tetraedralis TaxID=217068 RepID=A0A839Z9C0_9HYPH|nr:DUF1223 domain-containing protein [Ancylobacter tetraedralis]MBB3770507.1 hypothetical protein [Ancylobacter tetraedralis]